MSLWTFSSGIKLWTEDSTIIFIIGMSWICNQYQKVQQPLPTPPIFLSEKEIMYQPPKENNSNQYFSESPVQVDTAGEFLE